MNRPEDLFSAHLDAKNLSDAEIEQLHAWVASDPASIQKIVELGWLHEQLDNIYSVPRLLDELAASSPASQQAIQQAIKNVERFQHASARSQFVPQSPASKLRQPTWWLALAASLLIAVPLAVWLSTSRNSHTSDSNVATHSAGPQVAAVTALVAATVEPPLTSGGAIRQGESYRITSGIVQLTAEQGAVVVLEAPATFRFESHDHVLLDSGKLTARVENRAGFVVDTPSARILDLGTEFGVGVGSAGDTRVAVYDGQVRVEGNQDQGARASERARVIGAGRAAYVDSGGALRSTIEMLPHDREFIRPDEVATRLAAADGDGLARQWARFYELTRIAGLVGFQSFDRPTAGQSQSLAMLDVPRSKADVTIVDNLTVGPVDSSGGLLVADGDEVFLDLDTSPASPLAQAQLVNERGLVGRSGGELWLRWRTMSIDGSRKANYAGLSLMFGDERLTQEPLFFGVAENSPEACVVNTLGSRIARHPLSAEKRAIELAGEVHTWTARIIFSERSDIVSVWVDVPADSILSTRPMAELPSVRIAFDRLRLAVAEGGSPWVFDDFLLATSVDALVAAEALLSGE